MLNSLLGINDINDFFCVFFRPGCEYHQFIDFWHFTDEIFSAKSFSTEASHFFSVENELYNIGMYTNLEIVDRWGVETAMNEGFIKIKH